MKLSLLDRYKIVKQAVKAALDPQTKMVLTFKVTHSDPTLKVSGVYPKGFKYINPVIAFFAEAGAKSETLDELNKRVSGFNSMTVDRYVELNGMDRSDFGVLAKPVRFLPEERPIEDQPTLEINVKR